MTGSMYLSAAVTEVFAALVIAVVWMATPLGTLASIAVGLPIVLLGAVWFLPRSQALWVAIEHWTDRQDHDNTPKEG